MLRRLNLFQYFLPCCVLGLLLLALGGKLWLISMIGSPLADAAQWRAGLADLAPQWAQGNVVLASHDAPVDFPILARAVLGALLHANHQWDDRVTTILNTLLLAGTIGATLAAGARRLGWVAFWTTAVSGGVLAALPLGWEQSVVGSALPDRLGLFFALPAAWLLLDRALSSPLWWWAAASLLLAVTATDWTVAIVAGVGMVTLARIVTTRVHRGRDVAVLACAGLAVALHTWVFADHPSTVSWANLVHHIGSLCEPWPTLPWFAALIHAPLGIRCLVALRDKDRKYSLAPLAAVTAGGLLAMTWISAETRPRAWGAPDATADILLMLLTLSIATITQLWHLRWQSPPVRLALTSLWVALLAVGLNARVERIVTREIPARAAENTARNDRLRAALAAADPAAAATAVEPAFRPVLRAALRPVLPVSLQTPVAIVGGPATTGDFGPLERNQFSLPTPDDPAWAGGPSVQAEGGTVFISLPLPPTAPRVWRFLVAGDLGTPLFPFSIRSTSTGQATPLELDRPTGERWRTVNLVRPEGPAVIIAGPAALGTWGAFTHPLEMGLVSWYAAKLAKNWAWFLAAGGAVLLLSLLLPFAPRTPRRDTFTLDRHGRIRVASDDSAP